MNTAAISNKQSATMNSVNVNKKVNWMERFRAYLLDNAEYFAASSAMMTGNASAAVQIMKTARH